MILDDPEWYKDAVFYEVHVRAFADSNGDGVGDFRGSDRDSSTTSQELGVTALWLLPFYPSPLRDDGYDISDYTTVHPSYGTLRDFKALLREAHRRGLRVITELVLDPHLRRAPVVPAGPAGPGRQRRTGTSTSGATPPTATATPASSSRTSRRRTGPSTRSPRPTTGTGSTPTSPSLNYDNPAVRQADASTSSTTGWRWASTGCGSMRCRTCTPARAPRARTCPRRSPFLRDLRATSTPALRRPDAARRGQPVARGRGRLLRQGRRVPHGVPLPADAAACSWPLAQEDRFPIVDILTETPATPRRVPVGAVPAQPRRADARDGHRRRARLHVPRLRPGPAGPGQRRDPPSARAAAAATTDARSR